jgi:hypothetical protein
MLHAKLLIWPIISCHNKGVIFRNDTVLLFFNFLKVILIKVACFSDCVPETSSSFYILAPELQQRYFCVG